MYVENTISQVFVLALLVDIGVGPTRLPGMGRAAQRACPALPGS